jgi:hypothetical protein
MTALKALQSIATIALVMASSMASTSVRAEETLPAGRGTDDCHLFVGEIYDEDCTIGGCQPNYNQVNYVKVIVFDRTADRTVFEDLFVYKNDKITNNVVDQIKEKFSNVCGTYDY